MGDDWTELEELSFLDTLPRDKRELLLKAIDEIRNIEGLRDAAVRYVALIGGRG